jgi:hypothetical protein
LFSLVAIALPRRFQIADELQKSTKSVALMNPLLLSPIPTRVRCPACPVSKPPEECEKLGFLVGKKVQDFLSVKISEVVTTVPHSLISAASKSAGHSVFASHAGDGSVTKALQPAPDARCLWCGRDFTRRVTGGSAQKFCCTGHRQEFWVAARRWTMRAIDAGLLSVDCLKASHTSVHAAGAAVQ